MSGRRKVAMLGATRGMGRAMARAMAKRGDELVLLGRDLDDLGRSAADLSVRSGQPARAPARCDLDDPATFGPALAHARAQLEGLDVFVITAGDFATQDVLERDPSRALTLCSRNFSHTVALCEHARAALLEEGGGTLCVFSSVAGDRGRKPVVIYGASKAGLSAYLEGLDHRYRGEGLVTLNVKPGFVRTSMTQGLPEPPFAGEADEVATRVLRAMDRRRAVIYAPGIWGLVMAVIRRLPRWIMRRVGF